MIIFSRNLKYGFEPQNNRNNTNNNHVSNQCSVSKSRYWLADTTTGWRHQKETVSALLALCEGNPPLTGRFLLQRASNVELWCFLCCWANGWVNSSKAGDLRRHGAHYDVTVMTWHLVRSRHLSRNQILGVDRSGLFYNNWQQGLCITDPGIGLHICRLFLIKMHWYHMFLSVIFKYSWWLLRTYAAPSHHPNHWWLIVN